MAATARRDRKPQAPTPGKVQAQLDRVLAYAVTLRREYQAVYDYGHTSDRSGNSVGASGIDFSDPTGNIAALSGPKAQARKGATVSADKIADAIGKLGEALVILEHAHPHDRDVYQETVMSWPKVVTRDELKEAKAAARRREERDEL